MIKFERISKSYKEHKILDNISFEIKQGECVCLIGKSGKGKTTILNIIGLLENYDSGQYFLNNKDVSKLKRRDITKLFTNEIGYLFQNFALIDDDTVYNNIKVAQRKRISKQELNIKIAQVLKAVGLEGFEKKKIYQLSGGEQQRVAIARLLVKECNIILADEPTGSLDENTRDDILKILEIFRKQNKTIIIVSHDMNVAKWCDKIYRL